MPSVIDIVPATVETALVLAPELANIPVIGRLLLFVVGGKMPDGLHQVEALEDAAKKKKEDRATRKKRNARYVLKASDAMDCVEKNLMDGKLVLALGKGILNTILGRGQFAPDLIVDQIWTCIEEHELRQDTPRVKSEEPRGYRRPAKGHGHGRGKF